MSDWIEFIDYTFDRYTHLELSPKATPAEIAAEITKRKAQNHPDRLVKVDEKLKALAKENWSRLEDCGRILLNEELRPRAKRMYQREPSDPDLVAMYRAELEKKAAYLEVMGTLLWSAAGVYGPTFTDPKINITDAVDIKAVMEEHIERVRAEVIPNYVWTRSDLLQLGYDQKPVLLLTNNTNAVPASTSLLSVEIKSTIEAAQTRFAKLSEAVQANAMERAKVIEELLDLSPFKILHLADPDPVTIYLFRNETEDDSLEHAEYVITMRITGSKVSGKMEADAPTLADLKRGTFTNSAAAVLINGNLGDINFDIGRAFKRVRKALEANAKL